jgi:phosphate transport system substrate-binding protein
VPEGAEAGFERFILPDSESVASSPWAEEVFERIRHQGTHQAYVNLIDGAADFILVARAPSQDEMDAATARGVELDVRPVALDAFVFLANVENPVRTLAVHQARRVYTGEITTWAELGGPAEAIHAYQRDPNSGSQELMQDLVMGGAPMIEAPDMILLSMAGPIHALHDDVWGIGYSVYYYARYIFPDANVRLMGIDGVEPTAESIAGRTYPLTSEVYAVVRGGMSPESPAVSLRDWLLTAEGKAVIAESGYIPMP